MLDPLATVETVKWRAYPSWRQFAWLYLMSLLASARSLLLLTFGIPGWGLWLGETVTLLSAPMGQVRHHRQPRDGDQRLHRRVIETVATSRIEAAARQQAQTIVLGARGTKAIKRFLFGSVSQKVLVYALARP